MEEITEENGILLIEDDPFVQEVVGIHLRNRGFQVWVAQDPETARRLMEKHGDLVRLLIVDSGLPVQSGESIAEELKAKFGRARVLVISGYPRQPDEVTKYPFLQKPFTGAQLVETVEELIKKN